MIGQRATSSRSVRRALGDLDGGAAASPDAAHDAALWLLEARARTTLELRQRLQRRGFQAEAVEAALERLHAVGLIDDEAFARDLASSRAARGIDASRIVVELRDRGIDGETAARVVEEAVPSGERAARCREAAEARLPKLQGLAPEVRFRRLAAYLARRGYPGEIVAEVVGEVVNFEQ